MNLGTDQEFQYHPIDEHGLSRTLPKYTTCLVAASVAAKGKGHQKRKACEEKELTWLSSKPVLLDRPLKKARRCSLTITPSSLSIVESSVESRLSPVDLTLSEPSTDILESVTLSDGGCQQAFEDQPTPYPLSPVRFKYCDSTAVDSYQDDLFSQFLRSPSPDFSSVD